MNRGKRMLKKTAQDCMGCELKNKNTEQNIILKVNKKIMLLKIKLWMRLPMKFVQINKRSIKFSGRFLENIQL